MEIILNAIICYNNSAEIIDYIKNLAELDNSDVLAVTVVINDDKTNQFELEEQLRHLSIKYIVTKPHKNLGYMNGMIEGIRQYKNKFSDSIKWIVMSNTDITYPNKDFINKLLLKKYEEDIWCIGPSVFVPHKKAFDNPVLTKRRSLFSVNKTIIIFSIPVIRVLYQRISDIKTRLIKTNESESGYVYEVHGCCFIISMNLYKKILENPYKSFMYSEEAFIAEIVYHNHKRIFFDRDLKVEHNEHSVTSSLKLKGIAKLIASSMKDIKKEFYKEI